MKLVYAVVLPAVLIGCATPEQRAARQERQIAKATETCGKLGFKPETEGMANCRLQLITAEEANAVRQSGVAAQNVRNVQEATRLRPTP